MADSFYFYDLETSGINPREARIMQFAGQRTYLDLNPMGEPHNIVIALSDDILPDPEAILVTGITPQFTQSEGTTEADFLKTFENEIATPGTVFVGFNTIRFDDEFMRCLLYRNFYDPYAWQWRDDRSKWDLLDLVRMTRALRPNGINWPVDDNGKPTNRLELITALNGLDHTKAHDALNDVFATIALAKLLRTKQPRLFDYLFKVRDKKAVRALATSGELYVYTSGRYDNDCQKTTVVTTIAEHARGDSALVYDLRVDPTPFAAMSVDELVQAWSWQKPEDRTPEQPRLPIKSLKYNRCPAVAPLAVMDEDSQARLSIDIKAVRNNAQKIAAIKHWPERILQAFDVIEQTQQARFAKDDKHVDGQLYDGFLGEADNKLIVKIRNANPDQLSSYIEQCHDSRLCELLPLYKARNFPRKLTDGERETWEAYKTHRLLDGGSTSRLARYFDKINSLLARPDMSTRQKYILEDLLLYGQSIVPLD